MKIEKKISPAFEDYIFNWDYETYLCVGGYGSSKSYNTAFKIILKLLQEKRKALVIREVYDTIQDSCFDLISEILEDMNLLADDSMTKLQRKRKVIKRMSPLSFSFPNGSKIIFKGMDKPQKVKSINGVSIVWLEEAPEIKYDGFKELQGRLRTPYDTMHFILTCNPVSRNSWIYTHFFSRPLDNGDTKVIMPEDTFYNNKVTIKNGVYYHHSIPEDNMWLQPSYIKRLDELRFYDYPLYLVARWGRFGASGTRVLPQIVIQHNTKPIWDSINRLGPENQYFGFDFGFEESYNAVVSMSVDLEKSYLYIWDEIYINHITDDRFAASEEMQSLKQMLNSYYEQGYNKYIVADNEDPKAIQYYRQNGFRIRPCKNKFAGSRLSNTRKIKRFKKIIILPHCKNVINELKDLTYAKDAKGNPIYDKFNIDPHTFSAIWYALDTVNVVDLKEKKFNSQAG